jgi:uncharacterized protein (TIGR02301 family)
MSPRRGMCLIVATALAAPSPALAQSLFDLLTGGGRPAAPRSAPAPALSETKPPTPRSETKKRKPAAAKPSDRTQKSSTAATTDAPPAAAPPAPYEGQTLRLSEILGALAFLRELCAAGDGDDWRNKMTELLNAEAPSGPRRDKYVAAFNSGFRGYELTYRSCTPNARAAITRYLDEAGRLTGDLTYRYGGA